MVKPFEPEHIFNCPYLYCPVNLMHLADLLSVQCSHSLFIHTGSVFRPVSVVTLQDGLVVVLRIAVNQFHVATTLVAAKSVTQDNNYTKKSASLQVA
jgi:hypothetical protein